MTRTLQEQCAHGEFADCHLERRAELQVGSWAFSAWSLDARVPMSSPGWGPGMPVPRNFREAGGLYDFLVDFIQLSHNDSPLSCGQLMFSLKVCVDSKPLGKVFFSKHPDSFT